MFVRESFVFLVALASIAFLVIALAQHHRQKIERQRTIQRALESPALDDVSRRQILELLTDERSQSRTRRLGFFGVLANLVFAAGWLMLAIGLAIAGIGAMVGWYPRSIEPALIVAAVGFAIVTLPLALRELAGRRADRAA